ncbi:hypothetical protein OAK75_02690 [Bacteriovoracales bacterium]|nr:hypothetical protein [Bacteriovoracales bacterium]
MSLLKDVLEKAGFKATEPEKKKNRPSKQRSFQPRKKAHTHHKQRNTCEACQAICPDVELYSHKNPSLLHAKWICVPCADKNMIPDDQRKTAQSESSKQRTFRRYFGRTVKYIPKPEETKDQDNKRGPSNKNSRHQKTNSFKKKY